MIETSIYTFTFSRGDKYYLFNTANCLFAEISEELYRVIFDRDFGALDAEMLLSLINRGILIDSNSRYDYYNDQRTKYFSNSYDSRRLCLVIAPNSGCNFECPYCFEEKKNPKIMADEIIAKIPDFINAHIDAKTLSLTWYGGEPLLSFNKIKAIFDLMINSTDVRLTSHSIVTNGYLIDDEIIEFFNMANLNKIQITLDGTKDSHNRTRYLKYGKKPTYDKVIENIIKVATRLTDCVVSVRINISRSNSRDFVSMSKYFDSLGLKNISPYPGFIRENTPDNRSFCRNCLDGNNLALFYNSLKSEGIRYLSVPKYQNKGCMVNHINSYIIGPDGELYKCWNDFGNEEKIIGNISDTKMSNKYLFHRYMHELSAFSDAECKDCLLFPICTGGCSWYRNKNKFEDGKFNLCYEYKDKNLFENYLINTYLK